MTAAEAATSRPSPAALETANEYLYHLTLFVNGASHLSVQAIADSRLLCDVHLAGQYHLSIVDVDEDLPITSQVIATPSLVRDQPLPVRTIVGNLSPVEKVLLALDLPSADDVSTPID